MSKISAKIVADSINNQGDRITSMLLTFPRFILAELNTHRMLSKNSASSRAIPFNKMVEAVQTNPFIPIAWQKEHKGMQGTEYFTNEVQIAGCQSLWLQARDKAVESAEELHYPMSKATSVFHIEELKSTDVTKQLCNRLLEPFMWHTVLITGTEWENFFSLRCPQYDLFFEQIPKSFRSKKDLIKFVKKVKSPEFENQYDNLTELDWLQINKGAAEIHMMTLAECMWDAMNESTPKLLQPGEWHIVFEDQITDPKVFNYLLENKFKDRIPGPGETTDNPVKQPEYAAAYWDTKIKISTSMSARTSYTVVGDEKEFGYDKQVELHDRMANQVPFHASPFEHNARAMTEEEYYSYARGKGINNFDEEESPIYFTKEQNGWCRNFKGFIQYRELLENK